MTRRLSVFIVCMGLLAITIASQSAQLSTAKQQSFDYKRWNQDWALMINDPAQNPFNSRNYEGANPYLPLDVQQNMRAANINGKHKN